MVKYFLPENNYTLLLYQAISHERSISFCKTMFFLDFRSQKGLVVGGVRTSTCRRVFGSEGGPWMFRTVLPWRFGLLLIGSLCLLAAEGLGFAFLMIFQKICLMFFDLT